MPVVNLPAGVAAAAPAPAVRAGVLDPVASFAVQILGDSTGNEETEWVYLTALKAASLAPAFEVRHHVYDNTADAMPRPKVVQVGPAGERHMVMNGAAQSFPRWAGRSHAGDLDVRARVEPTNWASGGEQVFAAQFPDASANSRSWSFSASASGQLQLQWSTDGTILQTIASSGAWTPPEGPVWVRATLDVDNGAGGHDVKFYYSTDGVNYTQVGATVTRAGSTSLFGSTADFQIGGRGSGDASKFLGKFYEVEIRHGIGSAFGVVAPCLPELWRAAPQTGEVAGSPILTFVNGSYPGATFSFLSDPGRLARMTPDYGQVLTILSSSHNEQSLHGAGLKSVIKAYADAVRVRLPDVPFAINTQNPRIAPANRITEQAARRIEYMAWAKAWGWHPIDTYRAFLEDSRGVAALLQADGFHPNATGSQVWAGEVQRALGLA